MVWNEARVQQELHRAAVRHNLSVAQERKILEVIRCEDPTFDPAAQSGYFKNGIREESYGLAQINLPSFPSITKAQATDPYFAINFIASEVANGRGYEWSCWRLT